MKKLFLQIKHKLHTFTALLGVSMITGGNIPFQNAARPSLLYIFLMQSRIPAMQVIYLANGIVQLIEIKY